MILFENLFIYLFFSKISALTFLVILKIVSLIFLFKILLYPKLFIDLELYSNELFSSKLPYLFEIF